jgi:hypothetical protein
MDIGFFWLQIGEIRGQNPRPSFSPRRRDLHPHRLRPGAKNADVLDRGAAMVFIEPDQLRDRRAMAENDDSLASLNLGDEFRKAVLLASLGYLLSLVKWLANSLTIRNIYK